MPLPYAALPSDCKKKSPNSSRRRLLKTEPSVEISIGEKIRAPLSAKPTGSVTSYRTNQNDTSSSKYHQPNLKNEKDVILVESKDVNRFSFEKKFKFDGSNSRSHVQSHVSKTKDIHNEAEGNNINAWISNKKRISPVHERNDELDRKKYSKDGDGAGLVMANKSNHSEQSGEKLNKTSESELKQTVQRLLHEVTHESDLKSAQKMFSQQEYIHKDEKDDELRQDRNMNSLNMQDSSDRVRLSSDSKTSLDSSDIETDSRIFQRTLTRIEKKERKRDPLGPKVSLRFHGKEKTMQLLSTSSDQTVSEQMSHVQERSHKKPFAERIQRSVTYDSSGTDGSTERIVPTSPPAKMARSAHEQQHNNSSNDIDDVYWMMSASVAVAVLRAGGTDKDANSAASIVITIAPELPRKQMDPNDFLLTVASKVGNEMLNMGMSKSLANKVANAILSNEYIHEGAKKNVDERGISKNESLPQKKKKVRIISPIKRGSSSQSESDEDSAISINTKLKDETEQLRTVVKKMMEMKDRKKPKTKKIKSNIPTDPNSYHTKDENKNESEEIEEESYHKYKESNTTRSMTKSDSKSNGQLQSSMTEMMKRVDSITKEKQKMMETLQKMDKFVKENVWKAKKTVDGCNLLREEMYQKMAEITEEKDACVSKMKKMKQFEHKRKKDEWILRKVDEKKSKLIYALQARLESTETEKQNLSLEISDLRSKLSSNEAEKNQLTRKIKMVEIILNKRKLEALATRDSKSLKEKETLKKIAAAEKERCALAEEIKRAMQAEIEHRTNEERLRKKMDKITLEKNELYAQIEDLKGYIADRLSKVKEENNYLRGEMETMRAQQKLQERQQKQHETKTYLPSPAMSHMTKYYGKVVDSFEIDDFSGSDKSGINQDGEDDAKDNIDEEISLIESNPDGVNPVKQYVEQHDPDIIADEGTNAKADDNNEHDQLNREQLLLKIKSWGLSEEHELQDDENSEDIEVVYDDDNKNESQHKQQQQQGEQPHDNKNSNTKLLESTDQNQHEIQMDPNSTASSSNSMEPPSVIAINLHPPPVSRLSISMGSSNMEQSSLPRSPSPQTVVNNNHSDLIPSRQSKRVSFGLKRSITSVSKRMFRKSKQKAS